MSDKNFKIKPTTWLKEYTFEEFKMLNPDVNENILINYYNKYLFEHAEDCSRHINHFNDTKNNLSEEIKNLKNHWNFESYDSTVGPDTGIGRYPVDFLPLASQSTIVSGSSHITIPTSGIGNSFKPLHKVTVNFWIYLDNWTGSPSTRTNQSIIDMIDGGGYKFHWESGKVTWSILTRNVGDDSHGGSSDWEPIDYGNGPITATGTNGGSLSAPKTGYNKFWTGSGDPHYSTNFENAPSHQWFMLTGTFDGRFAKLYVNGKIADDVSVTNNIDVGATCEGISWLDKSYSDDNDMVIGGNGAFDLATSQFVTGSLSNLAIWSDALDANTINKLYNKGQGQKHNLTVNKYQTSDSRDGHAFLSPYVGSLELWFKLDDINGTTVPDSSGKGKNGTLQNATAATYLTSSLPYTS
tara:strand:- start:96 stop:1325 length:1230 start_codon:yes stop_codon:yes gene_type:complete